jgi:hypothetical protein
MNAIVVIAASAGVVSRSSDASLRPYRHPASGRSSSSRTLVTGRACCPPFDQFQQTSRGVSCGRHPDRGWTHLRCTAGPSHASGAPPAGSERPHPPAMFVVTEADAAAIRTAYERDGELSAAIELRRRSLASPTTQRRRNAPGPLPGGSRCRRQCPVTRCRSRKGRSRRRILDRLKLVRGIGLRREIAGRAVRRATQPACRLSARRGGGVSYQARYDPSHHRAGSAGHRRAARGPLRRR